MIALTNFLLLLVLLSQMLILVVLIRWSYQMEKLFGDRLTILKDRLKTTTDDLQNAINQQEGK